jgi:hypothetical protein
MVVGVAAKGSVDQKRGRSTRPGGEDKALTRRATRVDAG